MKQEYVKDLIETYADSLTRLAFSYTKNLYDAQDIVQDVFVCLMEKGEKKLSEEHMRAWLIRVTINKCKNHLKSAWISKRSAMPEEITYSSEENRAIIDAVLSLDLKYRIPIHLFYYEGYKIREIAEMLHKNPSTIGTDLERGRNRLKEILGDEFS